MAHHKKNIVSSSIHPSNWTILVKYKYKCRWSRGNTNSYLTTTSRAELSQQWPDSLFSPSWSASVLYLQHLRHPKHLKHLKHLKHIKHLRHLKNLRHLTQKLIKNLSLGEYSCNSGSQWWSMEEVGSFSPNNPKKQFASFKGLRFKAWLIIEVLDLIFSRALLLPWLLLYGAGIVACLASHLYFTRCQYHQGEFKNTKIGIFCPMCWNILLASTQITTTHPFPPRPKLLTNSFCSLCWREEKVTGMICLALAFIFLILWSVSSTTINHLIINWKPRSLVWLVAAQVTGHPKTLLAGNRFLFILEELSHSLLSSALTFQRL